MGVHMSGLVARGVVPVVHRRGPARSEVTASRSAIPNDWLARPHRVVNFGARTFQIAIAISSLVRLARILRPTLYRVHFSRRKTRLFDRPETELVTPDRLDGRCVTGGLRRCQGR
jgi:hypothetical protein